MKQFKVGHYTDAVNGTGCTVILCPSGTIGSGFARGAAPGTREFALLYPFRKVEEIHGLLLTGGSAFGLDAAAGVMRYLKQAGAGYKTAFGKIPIVPAAVIYDLNLLNSQVMPVAENAYEACLSARTDHNLQGNIGAGVGATVGKWAGLAYMMKGGLGISEIVYKDLRVQVLAVVNSVGDVVEEDGKIIAGAHKNKQFLAKKNKKVRWISLDLGFNTNTVLISILMNAKLNKLQLYYIAERAHNGIARAVIPAHTNYDGDIIFAFATNEIKTSLDQVAEIATEGVREAIVNGVLNAKQLGGVQAFPDFF